VTGPGKVFLVGIWAHEWPVKCKRWTHTSGTIVVPTGQQELKPSQVEGYPIGFEWWDGVSGELIKSCGDTERNYSDCDAIFEDGFETGATSRWSSSTP
jgi:hypothetical protein